MVVTTELVFQGLLISSFILMALSLPKIIVITLWSGLRLYIYERLPETAVGHRIVGPVQIEEFKKPEWKRSNTARELIEYTKDVKRPLIESYSAALFMVIAWANLSVDSTASALLLVFVILLLVIGLVVTVYFYRCMMKLRLNGSGIQILP
jgi:hypothetical protein